MLSITRLMLKQVKCSFWDSKLFFFLTVAQSHFKWKIAYEFILFACFKVNDWNLWYFYACLSVFASDVIYSKEYGINVIAWSLNHCCSCAHCGWGVWTCYQRVCMCRVFVHMYVCVYMCMRIVYIWVFGVCYCLVMTRCQKVRILMHALLPCK
jgi:hypothetical protein